MEKANYRDTLNDILTFTNGKHLLNIKQVCEYTGACRQYVTKRYPFKDRMIEAEKLAKEMC